MGVGEGLEVVEGAGAVTPLLIRLLNVGFVTVPGPSG